MAVSDERSLLPAGFLNPSVIFGTVSEYTIASRPGGRCGRLNIGRGSPRRYPVEQGYTAKEAMSTSAFWFLQGEGLSEEDRLPIAAAVIGILSLAPWYFIQSSDCRVTGFPKRSRAPCVW